MSQSDGDKNSTGGGVRIFGLPIQFVIVVVVSLALTIYLAGWAASNNVEARNLQVASMDSIPAYRYASADTEAVVWERAALIICPLH